MNPQSVYWASAAAMVTVIGIGTVIQVRSILRLRKATARVLAVAQERNELQKWASWTMLSVTDRNGMLYAATLTQMFAQGITERVWDDPIAVTLWHADSTLYGNWQQEADGMLRAALGEGPPEETTGG